MASILSVANLSKTYKSGLQALKGVNLEIEKGEIFALLGPNGAGKTTFVKMLLSSVHPTAGQARVFGRDSFESEARRPIGYLPENHRFPTYFTGAGKCNTCHSPTCDLAVRHESANDFNARWPEVRVGCGK